MNKNGKKYLIIYLVFGISFIVFELLFIQFASGLFNKFVLYKEMYVSFGKFDTVGNVTMMSPNIVGYFDSLSSKNFLGITIFFGWLVITGSFIAIMAYPKTAAWNLLFNLVFDLFFCLAAYLSAWLNGAGWAKVATTFFWVLAITILTVAVGAFSYGVGGFVVLGIGVLVMYEATSSGDISWAAFGIGLADILSVLGGIAGIVGMALLLYEGDDYDWINMFGFDENRQKGKHKKLHNIFSWKYWNDKRKGKDNKTVEELPDKKPSSKHESDQEWIDRMNKQHDAERQQIKKTSNTKSEETKDADLDKLIADLEKQKQELLAKKNEQNKK